MIFVTVGTHEQPFDRLVKAADEYAKKSKETVFIQKGYSKYVPKFALYQDFIDADQMENYVENAQIVVSHGGPASFMQVLECKKIPIVVPRLHRYNEHVNDHQLTFSKEYNSIYKDIIILTDTSMFSKTIEDYNSIIQKKKIVINLNNDHFNRDLKSNIEMLFNVGGSND